MNIEKVPEPCSEGIMNFVKYNKERMIYLLTIFIIILIISNGFIWWHYSKKKSISEVDNIVVGVKEMASLSTAQMYVMTTIEGEDNKLFGVDISVDLPGTKRIYFLVVPAQVTAGIDLQELSEDDVRVNQKEQSVEIILPSPVILNQALDLEKVKVYTQEGLLRDKTSIKEGLDLLNQPKVQEGIRNEAVNAGILKIAENNAEKIITSFFEKLGYQVVVRFGNY